MANPTIVTLTPNAWTKVATGVTGGVIDKLTSQAMFQTYRETGDPAPTLTDERVQFGEQLDISSNTAIDVYVWCDQAGKVRVNL